MKTKFEILEKECKLLEIKCMLLKLQEIDTKTQLEILEEKVRELKEKQAQCNHEWTVPKYDPERKEITTKEFVYLGSDSYYRPVGSGIFQNVDRWSRICTKCGKKEYAYEVEEVAVKTEQRSKFR